MPYQVTTGLFKTYNDDIRPISHNHAIMGNSAKTQQYSAIKIHRTITWQLRKIRCLFALFLLATGIAVAFIVLYAGKESCSKLWKDVSIDECRRPECIQVSAGKVIFYDQNVPFIFKCIFSLEQHILILSLEKSATTCNFAKTTFFQTKICINLPRIRFQKSA